MSLPAARENVALLRHVVAGLGAPYGIPASKMDDIVLALSEAATNAAIHAYTGEAGGMTVSARVGGDRMTLLVSDRGRGMTPRAQSSGLGVGLALIACVTESLVFTDHGDGGTQVAMEFDLTSS